ncbi:nmrA-like family domain-containing protein 1 [Ptychodera flava]|uniref:nmrA-like family domain-containing protein 1 n=1 Tax=Ptychodera flava TaxID=63121 RepID=UPI003969C6AA
MAKIITVFGATGLQGGSVVRALLKDPRYQVRAVTRHPKSKKAKALKELGVEVVKGDLDNEDSVKAAMLGSYGVFGVTNYFEYVDEQREFMQGKVMADAAKSVGVKHFIYSSLEKVVEEFGKPCGHFDAKGRVEDYMIEVGLPVTCVRYAEFMETIIREQFIILKMADGTRVIDMPTGDATYDWISAAGAGTAITAIFDEPSEFIGKTIGISGDRLSTPECAQILSKHFPQWIFKASTETPDEFSKRGFQGAEELAVMFEYFQTGKFTRDLELTRRLDPNTQTFEQWVVANKDDLEKVFK